MRQRKASGPYCALWRKKNMVTVMASELFSCPFVTTSNHGHPRLVLG